MSEIADSYTFISWFRRGLSTTLGTPDLLSSGAGDGTRSSIDLTIKINSAGSSLSSIEQKLSVLGPGDIIGVDQRAVIKTEPPANIDNFESNYLAYIEFYDEDFPWRYTPLSANNDRLRPWLALIVLEEQEFESLGLTNVRLPVIRIPANLQPVVMAKPDQHWAWAHSHLQTSLNALPGQSSEQKVKTRLDAFPNSGSSRILCPRRLKDRTRYHGFLIPAFEQGRLAGLGADDQTIALMSKQQSSWGHEQTFAPEQWPVYYQWSFSTGGGGDFESLVRKIKPAEQLDQSIGQRLVDIQLPGYGLRYAGGADNKGMLVVEGALRLPDNGRPPLSQSPEPEDQAFVKDLMALINLEEDLKQRSVQGKYEINPYFSDQSQTSIYDDPIVTVPFYGKHHVGQSKIALNSSWYNQLNLDPKYRMAAGLGSEIIKKQQEQLMARAWQQFGDIVAANQRIRRQQLSLELSASLFRKNFKTNKFQLKPPDLTVMTSMIHNNVKNGDKTVFGVIDDSQAVSNGFANPAYLRQTRHRGPLMRRLRNRGKPVLFKNNPSWTNWGVAGASTVVPLTGGQFTLLFKATAVAKPQNNLAKPFQDHFQRGTSTNSAPQNGINLTQVNNSLLSKMNPSQSMAKKLVRQIKPPPVSDSVRFNPDRLEQIMAAPTFPEPMYQALSRLSTDYLLPNLDKIPVNSFSLFENNENFIESFMVGLNHEMARELLWREYPTDQRGSYFRQFWDVADNINNPQPDITPIHQWPPASALGADSHSPGTTESELVFTIRGQLLEKYPNTVIYMQRARWKNKAEQTRELVDGEVNLLFPQFNARIDPDLVFYGFAQTVSAALGDDNDPGWFFVLRERPGELRFGLDIDSESDQGSWDNLSWNDFPALKETIDLDRDIPTSLEREEVVWGKGVGAQPGVAESGNGNAASMAWILLQKPFMVAIHASELIK